MLRDVLRITTAGSVDDGKSTLIARLLLDTNSVPADHLVGTLGDEIDLSRLADLLDGLESEKEQGITIDVAHRFFDSKSRRYHLSDSPGHEQYTRNMATAAAGADVVILVIDSSAGVKPQTKKHLEIAYQLGVRRFVTVANKFDLVDYSSRVFKEIYSEIEALFQFFHDANWSLIPVSSSAGPGVVKRGSKMRWYSGPTLLEELDKIEPRHQGETETVVSVQMVQRLGDRKRRYLGSVFGGTLENNKEMTILPSETRATVTNLIAAGKPTEHADVGSEIAFELVEDRDLERGNVLTNNSEITSSHHWDATLIWLDSKEGIIGRPYLAKLGYQLHRTTISRAYEIESYGTRSGEIQVLRPNGVYRVAISAQHDFALAPFSSVPELGRFILINPETGQTAGVGLVNYSLRRSGNIKPYGFSFSSEEREKLAGGSGMVLWLTGLSGSGKSTIADHLAEKLTRSGRIVAILDGDSLRTGLNSDLGFNEADRVENIRRTAEVAKIMSSTGLVVIASLISPYRQDRARAREIVGDPNFKEIHIATALSVCESRDPKGLYKKARAGEIPNFTGVNSPYEEPINPDLRIEGTGELEESTSAIIRLL